MSRIIALAPYAGAGFIEAHGLALIVAVLLWRARADRSWHLTAMAVELPLGINNLVFWQTFVMADMLAVGYITTSLHLLFAVAPLTAVATLGSCRPATRNL